MIILTSMLGFGSEKQVTQVYHILSIHFSMDLKQHADSWLKMLVKFGSRFKCNSLIGWRFNP